MGQDLFHNKVGHTPRSLRSVSHSFIFYTIPLLYNFIINSRGNHINKHIQNSKHQSRSSSTACE